MQRFHRNFDRKQIHHIVEKNVTIDAM